MGWLSNLFKKQSDEGNNKDYADELNGMYPIFSQYGTNIYSSDVVQQAINCIVSEMKKLRPAHIIDDGTDVVPAKRSSIQKVLNNPNPLMTTSEFLEKVTWLLFLNYNVFIIPTYYEWTDKNGQVRKQYEGLYPINPSQVDFIEDASGTLYVKFRFNNGKEYTLRYSDVIHIKKNYGVNQYMGGDEYGQPNNEPLLKTLDLNKKLLDGVSKAMNSSFAVNGVIKYNTMMDEEKMQKGIKELEGKLKRSESGFLPIDLKAEYIPIERDIEMVDPETLKFIDEKILRNFGVPLCILTGDYTKEQYEAFYQKTLEPLVIAFSQAFSKTLLSDGEKNHHNSIRFYPKDLIFMSIGQTLEMVRLLGDSGALYENEKRVAFGLMPLEELLGVRMQSLNYVNTKDASKYQVGGSTDGIE